MSEITMNTLHTNSGGSAPDADIESSSDQPGEAAGRHTESLRPSTLIHRDRKSHRDESHETEVEDKIHHTKKLCGIFIPSHWHPHITFYRTVVQIAILMIVFGLSWQYFASISTVSLVPQSQCSKCHTCEPQYELSAELASISLPFRYYLREINTSTTVGMQHVTFFSQWQSCGKLQSGPIIFSNKTTIHRTGNVVFPFSSSGVSTTYPLLQGEYAAEAISEQTVSGTGNLTDDLVDYLDDDGYGYLFPNSTALLRHQNVMTVTLAADILGGLGSSNNFTNAVFAEVSDVPTGNFSNMCFQLTCGVADYFFSVGTTLYSSSTSEVLADSTVPYIQVQAALIQTASTVTATCVGTVYGSPIPYYTRTNAVTQSNSYLCTSKQTMSQVSSLSFANLILAFGVMNFLAKASERISEIGWTEFFKTCGGRILDL